MVHSTNTVNDCYDEKTKTFDFNLHKKKFVAIKQTSNQQPSGRQTQISVSKHIMILYKTLDYEREREKKTNSISGPLVHDVYTLYTFFCKAYKHMFCSVSVSKCKRICTMQAHVHTDTRAVRL